MKGSLGAGKAIELGKVSSKNKTKTKKPTILQDPSISLYRNFLIQEFQVDLTLYCYPFIIGHFPGKEKK